MATPSEKSGKRHDILIIEPFYGGSHKQLVDLLCDKLAGCVRYTLPAKKWHWRARTSALYFSQSVPQCGEYRVLFTSSVMNLAELTALRPDLGQLRKVVYFHENQLVYPVRKQQDRDFQYGYNQILSSLVADIVLFNSTYNRDSFLDNIVSFLKLMPDHRPKGLAEQIRPKCHVLYFPLSFISPDYNKIQNTDATLMQVATHSTDCQAGGSFTYSDPHTEVICLQIDPLWTSSKIVKLDPSPSGHGECNVQNVKHILTSDDIEMGKPAKELSGDSQQNSQGKLGSDAGDSEEIHGDLERLKELETVDGQCCVSQSSCVGGQTTQMNSLCGTKDRQLHIVWAHRWEHDKDPETFFQTLFRLHDEGYQFQVSVMGETFTDVPEIFSEAKLKLGDHIVTWGYQGSKGDYFTTLQAADVAVSTARHEFFGVAMLEAVHCGCYPLCPDNLVYPEIFPAQCLYKTASQLYKRLREYCRKPHLPRTQRPQIDLHRFQWETLQEKYEEILYVD